MQNKFLKIMPWFFFAAAFQSLFPAFTLLSIPTESGISSARLALLGILFLFFSIGIYLGFHTRKDFSTINLCLTRTSSILVTSLLFLTCSLVLFLLRYLNPELLLPYYERVSPLLWYILIISFEIIIYSLLLKHGFHPQELSNQQELFRIFLVPCSIIFAVYFFVVITKIGITPDTAYWGEPGVPIQGWHFVIVVLLGLIFYLLSNHYTLFSTYSFQISNYILPIGIYVLATFLWLSVPYQVLENSFYFPISPPANIPFPYSDAGLYDTWAQSLLIGSDYFGGIPPRPLYVTFLALLHFLFGHNYPAIIIAQTCVLAIFPVALYFLGKKLHTLATGVTVAGFAIFREYTNLIISSETRVANSKIFTTDFPTALAITLICLVCIWWLENRNMKSTLIAGGAFGIFLLFRTQSTITLPALFLLVLFMLKFKWAEWIKTGIIFAIAMFFSVIPWLTHNYTVAGQFSFDDPAQVAIIYSQYSFTGNLDLSQFNPETDSVRERIISFTLENPKFVTNFILTHILNTEIGGVLSLPLIKPFNGIQGSVNLYWMEWDGTLEWYNHILIIFYLLIISLGIASAWKKINWLGLIPLAFNLGYVLSNGIARFSSWRYNLPVDWVIYFYFAIGLVELYSMMSTLFRKHIESTKASTPELATISVRDFRLNYFFIFFVFALVGSTPWLAKGVVTPKYLTPQKDLVATLNSNGFDKTKIQNFLAQSNSILLEGQLLYPRMYWRGEGLSSTNPWPAYKPQDFPRMGFIVINQDVYHVIFPSKELIDFKQGVDVILLACNVDGLYYARIVHFENQTFQSDSLLTPCN